MSESKGKKKDVDKAIEGFEEEIRLEIDTDDLTPEQAEILKSFSPDLLGDLEGVGAPASDLEELFEQQHNARLGKWFDWPHLAGAKIKIAHWSSLRHKLVRLTRQFREDHGIFPGRAIEESDQQELLYEATFGTVVKDWSGMVLAGDELPFNWKTYRRMVELEEFDIFVGRTARRKENFRQAQEAAEKKA